MPLPNLRGQMKGVMNSMDAGDFMQTAPVPVAALFDEIDLSTPDNFLDAL